MSERLKLYILIAIRNIIDLICFTVLAIVFKKWWLVFFALIFWAMVEKEEK